MEILVLVSIIGVVGLAVSSSMLYVVHCTAKRQKEFGNQEREDLFRRIKFNASRFK